MKWILPIIVFALILSGCESSGELRVRNRTNNIVYFTIDGSSYEVPGQESKTVDLYVDRDWEIFETNSKEYLLEIEGETFLIWDEYNDIYIKDTEVVIEDGKTLDVYAIATHACVKVVNNTDQPVISVTCDRYDNGLATSHDVELLDANIPAGEDWFYRLQPSYENHDLSYGFTITMDDGSFDNAEATILEVDDCYLIELE